MTRKILTLFVASLMLLIAPACNTLRGKDAVASYNADPLTVAVPAGKPADQVQAAMVKAFEGRGWTIVSSTPDEVVGQLLDHRGFNATATLVRSGDMIRILSDATYYVQQRDEYQPAVPKGWLENLQKDLKVYLQRTY